jgi:hypothetical protein
MKTMLIPSRALLACAALILTVPHADARVYGVSASSAGRGTVYHGSGGGSAYVGPRGAVAQGPNGNVAAANRYGGAVAAGPNGAVARGAHGGVAAVGPNGGVVAARPVAAPLPAGYIRTVPVGYRPVYYGGYNCMFVGGIYYRPVMYQGATVYVVVR